MLTLEALSPSRHPCPCQGALSVFFASLLLPDHQMQEIRAVVCSSLCPQALRIVDRHIDTGPVPPSPLAWLPGAQNISTTAACTASLTVPLPPSPKLALGEQYTFTPPGRHPCSQNTCHQMYLLSTGIHLKWRRGPLCPLV